MKKILFALVAGFIPALVATNGAYAQNSVNPEILEPQKNATAIEKAVAPVNNHSVDMGEINAKALKHFTKTYKNVTGESWQKIKDGYTAKFNSNGVSNRIFYSPNGKWSGSLKGYSEDKLPQEIRHAVKREYYDYIITYVQEVETTDSYGIPTYIIHLEDKNNIKQVRFSDGQMEVWKEFKKQ